MTSQLAAVSFIALEPALVARFWSELLGGAGFPLRFLPTDEPKIQQNRAHFDLNSESLDGQQRTVARALELGARHVDVGQKPEEGHVVLADPEGNEFCVVEPGNNFLAGCGLMGALSCDGSKEVGRFWSAALGWPLVWDQNEETAIQSPAGGTKISWGGPPYMPRAGRDRVRLDLLPAGDQLAEVERLISLGATRIDTGRAEPGCVELADPDGNEFSVQPTA